MPTKITFFGYAGYKIITPDNKHIVIDPFLTGNPAAPLTPAELEQVDLLLLTHNAYDHFGDAPEIIDRYQCKVICALDVLHRLKTDYQVNPDLLRVTIWGMAMQVDGIPVRPMESHHWSFGFLKSGEMISGPAMGFIVETEPGVRIYHPGDTALTMDMKMWADLYKPTVGLMHVALPEDSLPHMENYLCGELTEEEALLASQWLGLEHIITSHYISKDTPAVKKFMALAQTAIAEGQLKAKVSAIDPGETLEI